MNKFTLSLPAQKVLVSSIKSADGKEYQINPDFRVLLGCFRKLSDPDIDQMRKAVYVAVHFFCGNPPPDGDALFRAFVSGDSAATEQASEPEIMDFETDAEAIYAGFRQQYGIDLLRTKMHWYEFKALLSGLADDTEYRQRIKIRQIKPEDIRDKDRPALRRMQDAIAIKPRVSKEELSLQEELNRKLENGEDPGDILKQLQEV